MPFEDPTPSSAQNGGVGALFPPEGAGLVAPCLGENSLASPQPHPAQLACLPGGAMARPHQMVTVPQGHCFATGRS